MPDEPPRHQFELPDQDRDPVEWDAGKRAFVPKERGASAARPAAPPAAPAEPGRDPRRFYVGSSSVGQAPPARQGSASPIAPPQPPHVPPSTPPPVRTPAPLPRPAPRPGRRLPRFRRPKLRWILLLCTLLPILLLIAGFIYADLKFRE